MSRACVASLAVLLVVTGAGLQLLSGCGSRHEPPMSCSDGFVDLDIVADPSVPSSTIDAIVSFDVVSVATAYAQDLALRAENTFTSGQWINREQLFRYTPPLTTGPLEVTVTALDVSGHVVAAGTDLASFADCGQVGVTITLRASSADAGASVGLADMQLTD